ncbi:LuxR C-terminal-related transcriptional regulator [Pseudarthrobacter sp. PH31-O2]|uniref:LuxR C-terminal-related transcriptional regulator n=1 Tax=Pseudarthrobacter sp. PH31-O2 TaxID=3046206 RepID=UPI0024BA16E7|nr:LuxR C-terminal-related transcriptional regulator [Pseudarthrobacter sp. PH31-O2]MDJ0353935.1 LuxR C-terminal-related transcriptional regulator [Pseudarthrobacter sp. PH31-O2]
MAYPIIATKLFVPKLRRALVPRPRLSERLRGGAEPRLTLISAPAGFGKTTLLAEWLAETPGEARCVAWLALDPADNEPASFWTYVVNALQMAVPGIGPVALELIASRPMPTELVLATMLNDLAAAAADVWLVLDDYHVVDSGDISAGMVFLLEHLPPRVHVVISTRADPDLPLSRWRVRGELIEIRAADLRFTSEEAAAYLKEVAGLDLAADDVATLEERTEGWIAALQLAALSLQRHDDVAGFIARFAGNDRYVLDYLVEEVLRHQPDAVRRFLLDSAVLNRLTGPLCDALTGRGDGSQMLTALERANLFLVPLDDRREWYRYHNLFADVLRARLLSEHPERIPLLHQRASRWYESHDQSEDAVRHALATFDFDRAVHLMELAVPVLRRNRQDAVLHSWLSVLPEDAIRRSPVLSVFFAGMLMASGDLDGVESWLDDAGSALAAEVKLGVPESASRGGTTPSWAGIEEVQTLPSTIAVYRASLAQARGDMAATSSYARQALELAGPDDHLARGGAAGFLGLAAWAAGDVRRAARTFSEAVASLRAGGNLVDELSGTVVLADLWLAKGRPGEARRLYQKSLKRARARGGSMARASSDLHVGLGEIDRQAGDLGNAKQHLELAAAFVHRGPMTESRYRWFVASGLVARDEGNHDRAIDFLDQAEELYRPGFFPDVRPIAAIKARVWIAQGALSEAAGWARERGLSVTDEVSYLREYNHLTLVRLLIAQERADPEGGAVRGVHRLLAELLTHASASGRAGSVVEILMLQGLVYHVQGHRQLALEALRCAWEEASEPDEYVRLFLDEGAPMVELLRSAMHDGGTVAHASRLLNLGKGSAAQTSRPGERPASAVDSLSEREIQVLKHLDSALTGPEIARELFISHNTLRSHTKHVFTKLGVTSRRAAVICARDHGLI